MVTASHNPKRDNGFKVYWGNGAQIIPPHDSGIAAAIADNLAPWHQYDSAAVESNSHTEDVTDRVAQSYYHSIASLNRYKESNTVSTIRVAYTGTVYCNNRWSMFHLHLFLAMHGVGCQWIRRAFQTFDHSKPFIVPEQAEPDPSFPTVVFPNPEEKGALDESFKFAKENRCTLILANDPDADRLAAAEWVNDKGEWYVFSGNELGVLLGHWQIVQWNQANESGSGKAIPAVLASVVSSRMLQTIARRESITYRDTLTGIKVCFVGFINKLYFSLSIRYRIQMVRKYCFGLKSSRYSRYLFLRRSSWILRRGCDL